MILVSTPSNTQSDKKHYGISDATVKIKQEKAKPVSNAPNTFKTQDTYSAYLAWLPVVRHSNK